MRIKAHCYLENAKISKHIFFTLDKTEVNVYNSKVGENGEGLCLEISQPVDVSELAVEPKEEQDEKGEFIEKRLKKYKYILQEAADVVEGTLSVNYFSSVPRFDTDRVVVNVIAENDEERKLISDGKVTGGFGNVFTGRKLPIFEINNDLFKDVDIKKNHLAALSIFAEAVRAKTSNDEERSFFLFFRILEGYLGDGTPRLEKAIKRNKKEFEAHLPFNRTELMNGLDKSLSVLHFALKNKKGSEGVIADLVLLRHKLTHFDEKNSERHYAPEMRFELGKVNMALLEICLKLIRQKLAQDVQL
jgi:hypothetical protein